MGLGGKRESLTQDEKGQWMYVSSMQNLMKKQTKKKKTTEKSNPLHDFFQGVWQSKNKLIEIRQVLEISLEKQQTDRQDGIQQ